MFGATGFLFVLQASAMIAAIVHAFLFVFRRRLTRMSAGSFIGVNVVGFPGTVSVFVGLISLVALFATPVGVGSPGGRAYFSLVLQGPTSIGGYWRAKPGWYSVSEPSVVTLAAPSKWPVEWHGERWADSISVRVTSGEILLQGVVLIPNSSSLVGYRITGVLLGEIEFPVVLGNREFGRTKFVNRKEQVAQPLPLSIQERSALRDFLLRAKHPDNFPGIAFLFAGPLLWLVAAFTVGLDSKTSR